MRRAHTIFIFPKHHCLAVVAIALISLVVCTGLQSQTVESLVESALNVHMQKPDSCLYYANLALAAAGKETADTLVTTAVFLKGWNLNLLGRYQEAIATFHQLLKRPDINESHTWFIRSIGRIGVSWRDLGKFDSAMVYLQRYDGLIDQYFGSMAIEGKLELGELYRAMDRLDESNAYKLEAIRRARESGNRVERITTLYYYLDDNAEHMMESGFSEYLDEYLDLIGEQQFDGTIDYSHAGLLLVRFKGEDKLAFLENGVAALEKIEHSKALMFLVHELVTEYRATRRYADAHKTALKGMRIARERNEIPYILTFQQDLYGIAEQQGRFDSAFKYLLNYHDLKDRLSSTMVMAKVDSLKIQFETVKKEQQITDQRLQIQQRTNQRNLLIASIAVLVCFAAFGILFLWSRNRMTKKLARQESHIQEQRIQQLEQEKQLVAMNSVLEGQETERVRIASDLHDGLGGLLGTIKARFSSMQNGGRSPEQQLVYEQVDTLINTASQEVRRISHNMAPHALRLSGLHDALGDLAKQINTPDLDVEFQWYGVEDRMEESTEIMLYRIIQELTNNVRKYAQARSLLIQVNRFNDQLSLIVEDDGRGFDLEKVRRADGLGLRSVQSRVEFLKGTMDIDTRPGDGTLVSVRIPL